jgi:hypothetical protein
VELLLVHSVWTLSTLSNTPGSFNQRGLNLTTKRHAWTKEYNASSICDSCNLHNLLLKAPSCGLSESLGGNMQVLKGLVVLLVVIYT